MDLLKRRPVIVEGARECLDVLEALKWERMTMAENLRGDRWSPAIKTMPGIRPCEILLGVSYHLIRTSCGLSAGRLLMAVRFLLLSLGTIVTSEAQAFARLKSFTNRSQTQPCPFSGCPRSSVTPVRVSKNISLASKDLSPIDLCVREKQWISHSTRAGRIHLAFVLGFDRKHAANVLTAAF